LREFLHSMGYKEEDLTKIVGWNILSDYTDTYPELARLFSVSSVSSSEETEEAEEAPTFGRDSSLYRRILTKSKES